MSNKYRVIVSYWLMLKLTQQQKLLLWMQIPDNVINVSWLLQIHKFVTYFRGLSEKEIRLSKDVWDEAPEEADSGNRK